MKELLLIKTIKFIIVRSILWLIIPVAQKRNMNFINWIIYQDVYDVVYHLVCP